MFSKLADLDKCVPRSHLSMILKDLAFRFLQFFYKLSGDSPYEFSLDLVSVCGLHFAPFWVTLWSFGPWGVKRYQTVMKNRCGNWHQKKYVLSGSETKWHPPGQ